MQAAKLRLMQFFLWICRSATQPGGGAGLSCRPQGDAKAASSPRTAFGVQRFVWIASIPFDNRLFNRFY
jgi:hypothetical protein